MQYKDNKLCTKMNSANDVVDRNLQKKKYTKNLIFEISAAMNRIFKNSQALEYYIV